MGSAGVVCECCEKYHSSVNDETYRRAGTKAAERHTSLSALRRFLVELVSEESSERGLERQERDLRAQIRDFTARDRLSREDATREALVS